jgi:hypothetical protein
MFAKCSAKPIYIHVVFLLKNWAFPQNIQSMRRDLDNPAVCWQIVLLDKDNGIVSESLDYKDLYISKWFVK